jgi:hypothetical protein
MMTILTPQEIDAIYLNAYNTSPGTVREIIESHHALQAQNEKLKDILECARTNVNLLLGAVLAKDPNSELRVRCQDILTRTET